MEITLKKNTQIEIAGQPVTLISDTKVEIPVEEIQHAAEWLHSTGLSAAVDLSHKETIDGIPHNISYGAAGVEIRTPIETEAPIKTKANPKGKAKAPVKGKK